MREGYKTPPFFVGIMPVSSINHTKSINVIKCLGELVIPYINTTITVLFQNMSVGTTYSSIVYGFEIIEYY